MNKLYLTGAIVFFLMPSLFVHAQAPVNDTIKPQLISDYSTLQDYIVATTKYPEFARKNCLRGKVTIGFRISSLGNLEEISILKNSFKELDEESIRVIASTQGKWKAATVNGSPVDFYMTTPFNFWFEDFKCDEILHKNEGVFYYKEYLEEARLLYESGTQKLVNKQYEEALKDFNESLRINATYGDALYNRGICKLKLGDKEGACKDWKKSKLNTGTKAREEANQLLDKYCK